MSEEAEGAESSPELGSQVQEERQAVEEEDKKLQLEAEEGGEIGDEKGGEIGDDEVKRGEADDDTKGGETYGDAIAKGRERADEAHERAVEADEEALTLGGGTESALAEEGGEEGEGATAAPPAGATELELLHDPQCVFCKIAAKEQPAQILYEDSHFICFWDNRPAATHHYLVIPKTHAIRDPKALTVEHVPVIERMVEIGKQVLTGQGGSVEGSRIGFHWPPVVWVKHLHLHVIGPESSMNWFNRKILYRLDSFTFVTHTWMVQHLKTRQ